METIDTGHKDDILPGYQIGKLQYKSSRSVYLLGLDLTKKRKVLVRFLKKKQPVSEEISRLNRPNSQVIKKPFLSRTG